MPRKRRLVRSNSQDFEKIERPYGSLPANARDHQAAHHFGIKGMGTRRETSSAILIDTFGRLLFQQRDDNPEISYPGKIGLFGGHREGTETFLECVVREVYEEISYFLPPESFAHLTSYEAADPYGGAVHAEIFIANNVPVDRLVITEGALLMTELKDVVTLEPRFSPSARFAMNAFLNDQRSALNRLRSEYLNR